MFDQPIEVVLQPIEPDINLLEPGVDASDAIGHPRVNLLEPRINLLEPCIDLAESGIHPGDELRIRGLRDRRPKRRECARNVRPLQDDEAEFCRSVIVAPCVHLE